MKTTRPRCRALRILTLTCLLTLPSSVSLGVKHAHGAERWLGAGVGADFSNFDPMGTVSFEWGLWPKHKKVGYQAYVEYANASCDDPMWTVGAEAIWRFTKKLYGGAGLALSDERLCDRAGTKWNFTTALGMRVSKRVDIQWRHRSHGDDLGIRKNTPNDGVNLIQIRVRH